MPRIALAVVGGSPMRNEISAPYIAAIGDRSSDGAVSWFCGGSLLSSKDVLTAAHCLISRNATLIRVGSFSAKQRLTGNDYEISETIIHPSYKITVSYHDIAVVKIKDKIKFTKNIKPVCLPQDDRETFEKKRARVVGWGAEEFGGEGTQRLQQVEVEIFSNSNCEKAYSNSTIAPKTFPNGIKRQQLCAGSSRGGKDACQGDSGGPLVLTDESGVIRQIGVVSTGAGCGFKQYPGVYTRVSSYYDWIQEQIKKSESNKETQSTSKRPDSRDSSRGKEQSSQYKNDASQDQYSKNHLTTSKNHENQNKKYGSREQFSAKMSQYNQPTETLYVSQTPKSSYSRSQESSHLSHSPHLSQSTPSSNSNRSSYLSMPSQSQQSSHNSRSPHQLSSFSESTNTSKNIQRPNFETDFLTHSQHSSHPIRSSQTTYNSNSRQPSSSSSYESQQQPSRGSQSYQSNFQQPSSQISQSSYLSNSQQPTYQTSQSSYLSNSQQPSYQFNSGKPSSQSQTSQPSYEFNYRQTPQS